MVGGAEDDPLLPRMDMAEHEGIPGERTGLEIAVVGLAGRFAGAGDIDAFWRNLREGVESISFFTRDELLATGADPALLDHPDFVRAGGELRGADEFDAGLFNLTPRDAEILNPQHRVLLECAWEALEHAGYDPARVERPVGVFAGSSNNDYVTNLVRTPELVSTVGYTRISLGNARDHLAAGISYRLNLRGPSLVVQTACSTSLVAVHLACQSLLGSECDMALAGGVSVPAPLRQGYLYTPDGIVSPDGHVRAFDAGANGTVGGSGAGLVVLKRLDDALADGDTIHVVIRGSAVNNDGAQKVGYTAPSVAGQARVLSEAMSMAGVDPATVQYLETHGSGTPLGDAIELKAMSQVLAQGDRAGRCAIGSVKTNVGHLDAASGIAGLIKTVLSLAHAEIPPSLNFAVPHPEIEASGGRVFVNTALAPWERNGSPRRAGVSSFGIGGTNAHVVLEEAPAADPSGPSRPIQLLVVSARTPSALASAAARLADRLERQAPPLADAAYTLQTGRREMEHRLGVVCADAAEGAARLRERAHGGGPAVPRSARPVAFMFPGVGTHHVDMARGLYDAEPVFRAAVDECCDLLLPVLGSDLREVLYSPGPAETDAAAPASGGGGWDLRRLLARDGGGEGEGGALGDTRFTQPAVFVTEYALARLWMRWGVEPRAVIGHSLGEYVAATVAGVLRLEDALRLVALRARMIDALPAGAMLAVPLGETELRALLPATLDLAAVNTPGSCVVAGPRGEVEAFEAALAERGTVSRRLPTRHAFHSRGMEGAAAELERLVAGFELRAPGIPFVSNVTGTWITDDEARSPAYWARHMCRTVRFSDGLATLRAEPGWVLLEVGPGQALGAWAQHAGGDADAGDARAVFSSLRHQHNRVPDLRFILETLGGLWTAGVEVDWAAFSRGERRKRIPLPGYPFERRRYWVDPPRRNGTGEKGSHAATPAPPAGYAQPAANGGADANREKGPDVMENRTPAPAEAAAHTRQQDVLALLKGLASELTGMEEARIETDADFFQAGFDSLLLLQAIQAIEKRVGIRVSLVELLEDVTSLGALASHIDRALPPEAVVRNARPPAPAQPAPATPPIASEPVPVASADLAPSAAPVASSAEHPRSVAAPPTFYPAPAPAAASPGGGEGGLERVIARQLQLMSEQIAAMRGDPAAAGAQPAASAAAPQLAAPVAPSMAHADSPPAPVAAAADGAHAVSAPPASTASWIDAPAVDTVGADASSAVSSRAVPQSPRARIQPQQTFVPFQPVNTEGRNGMTAAQSAYLDAFIERYVARTQGSKKHQQQYHRPLADTRVTARFRRAWKEILYPVVGARAAGSRVWDVDGNEYVDIGMGFGCNLFGHAPDFVTRAIQEEAARGYGLGPQSPNAGRAAQLVCELGGNERAVFCNSGTEAVMGAIRAARALTGRSKVAYFAGSYHGWSDLVLGRLFTAGGRREVRPTAPGVAALPLGDVLMLDFDEPSSLDLLARHIADVALVMVEPVQSRRPDLQPFAFLRELRRMTREAGTLLLFDELITGFRMGAGGAQSFFGIDADLVTYGKIVAGGLPMGVVAGTEEAMSVFDGGVWSYGDDSYPTGQRTIFAGAYFKHPISMAVACSILGEIKRRGPEMYERLNARTTRLVERINAFFEAEGYPVTAAHFSSCFRFFFGAEVKFSELFNHHMILEGVHVIPETGTHFLSAAHTDEDADRVFDAVRASVRAMREGGFIPPAPGGNGTGATTHAASGSVASPSTADGFASAVSTSAPPSADGSSAETRDDGVRVVPLTEGQRQLWFESQMGDDAARAYTESTSVRLRGELDVGALREALQALVDRHDTLRATFAPDGEAQLIHPVLAVEVPLVDFRGEPAATRRQRVDEWVRETARRPFDLVGGPLVRFALAAVEDDEHLLVKDAHHAVLDGWSFGVIWRELGALYTAAREGRRAELPPRPDHATLVRAQIEAVRDPAAEAFWIEQFADGVPVLELPTDRPRPPVRGYAGERLIRVMDGELLRRIAAAGRPHGLTVFNTLFSAFFVWLGRLSGQDDLVVGTPAAGQAGRAGAAELVGYGINVLPIRARLDPSASFVEHARRVRRNVMRALDHQSFSFPRLVEALPHARDTSRPPVFSAMMNLDRSPGEERLGDLRVGFDGNFGGGSKLDLTFGLTETPDELRLRCDYATELFDRETVERWLAAFERLLEAIAIAPDTPLAELDLMGAAERALVLDEWNRTARPVPGTPVHRMFEAQAARTPAAIAVLFGGHPLTYAELDRRANRIAHALRRRGVGPDVRVALFMEHGPGVVAAALGVMKAGGAYVPLDPASPADRLGFLLADSGAVLVLADDPDALPAGGPPVLAAGDGAFDGEREDALDAEADPRSLVYVIYTSGSTGRSKGVGVEHRSVANLVSAYVAGYDVGPGARLLSVSPMHFDMSVTDVFVALCSGATLVMAPRDELAPGPGLVRLLRERGVTHAKFTPTALAALPDADLPQLRAITTGGEASSAELVARWAPGRRYFNGYGPTEAAVRATFAEWGDGTRTPPLGRPAANVRAYVLDGRQRPVPVGVAGELYLGGVQVARGYLGRPALTAEKFVPDPFGPDAGGRLYRTGDRVRWRADGNLAFIGRVDFQVKVRGFRVEPGEVETALLEHPGVADAVVTAHHDPSAGTRLVAYVAPGPGAGAGADAGLDAHAIREHLKDRLPDYMVPSAIVVLERLPLATNGKVDRRALPAPDFAAGREAWAAPRTPAEEILAGIFAEVLKVPRVGAHDDFFALGGHSLLATRVIWRVREAFEVELPLRALFEGPTVSRLAERVEALRHEGEPQLPPVIPVARGEAPPLSFAQERLWFLDRLEPDSGFYNIPAPLRLGGALDVEALERTLGELLRRHESLRTSFPEMGGAPVQRIAPFTGYTLPVEDLSALEPAEREAAARRAAAEDMAAPFDLAEGPVFRARLLRLADDDHLLLACMHHIVGDEWSMGIFYRELSALYDAYSRGEDSPLPELPVQYADYSAWQRDTLRGERLERQLAWWRERLAGAPALLEIPTDRPRPAVQSYRGSFEGVSLSGALLERLQGLAGSEGATLHMVLLGAFQLLLARYGGSDDVVVGTTIAGRARREVEGLIGFFVNTLALRTDLSGDPTFREVVRRVREVTLGAYEHQEVPFEVVVAELRPERTLSHSPLVQVLFELHNMDADGGDAVGGLQVRDVDAGVETTKFDLSLELAAHPHGVTGAFLYSTDLFDRATIQRMLAHLRRVLEQVGDDADLRLSRLELAGPDERALVLDTWNRTAHPFPGGACVHELFEAQVARTPEALALAWGDETLAYRELDARANRLAHHLVGLGVRPETRVGVLLERGVEMVVATLAVMKAGGCCVPVDTTYPPERMALMLADAGAGVLLTQGALGEPLAGEELRVVSLDGGERFAAEPADPPRVAAAPGNLAYVFYTSGSTGRPKGVMMAHREVVQFAACLPECMPLGPGDRVAQASNASFDAAVFEIWGALAHGAALVGVDRDVLLSAPILARALRDGGITHLYQTAALFNQHVLEEADVYAPLRQLVFGAEAVGTEGVRRMLREGRPGRVLHEYGPTEATVWCTLHPVDEVAEDAATVSIGRPVPNARAYVLDPGLEALPVGVPGELCVGGDGVVRGYLGRPALTAERFLPDPFAPAAGGRMYRTGDRVRWKGDGTLEFMGRLDDQVKVRGFRIEPGEVESALALHPGVVQARVIVREDAPGDKRLVAYVVGDAGAEALRAHLGRTLPAYMVPQAFVAMDRLPLTPNGKLDRRSLPVPGHDGAAEGEGAAPRTPAEEVLAGIWADVLGRERVGMRESFFALGGHSLLATRLVSRVRAVFGVELPVRALFEGPTVAQVAARVEALRRADLPVPEPPRPVDREGPLPLSFAQERLWFLDRLQQGGTSYNVSQALRLSGAMDVPALERALGEVVRRHESLRTTFTESEGVAAQVIAPFRGFTLPVEDLSAADEREAAARARAEEDAGIPFDLETGPLFRARLLRLAHDEHVLLLAMHHIVSDGWSMQVLFRELWALYEAFRDGRPSTLPELPVQYADFAVWQRRQSGGEAEARQLAWWKARLGGAPELLELPTDHPRPPVPSFRGGSVPVRIAPAVADRLRELARREGATLYMVVLAAFHLLLSRYSGSDDVVVGTPIAGRTREELEGLVGLFMNTLVLRADLSGDPAFRALVGGVRESVLGAYEHQEAPFERVVAELQPERSLSHSTLFQVMFQLDTVDAADPSAGGLRVGDVEAGRGTTKFDLTLVLFAHDGGITGGLQYATDLFERATAARMVEHLARVLEQVAEAPDAPVSRVELMGGEERERVAGWNRTGAPYPADRCIHQLFEAQAVRTPAAVAVVCGDDAMTFGELDERANRLARHLAGMGVGPEVRVGLCMERGPELMVAILGVMKAGGAYVPLDPAFPPDRIAYLLGDSGVGVLLTQERLAGRLPDDGVRLVAVDREWERIAVESAEPLESGVTAANLAYVIYTSGSTGLPKGVAMHHRGVANYIHWGITAYGADRGNGAPVFTSMAVDLTVTNLLPLFAGHPVRLLPEESPVEALAQVLREKPRFGLIKITPIHLGLLNTMLDAGDLAGAAHTLVVGADFLSAEPTVYWQEQAPGVRLMNEYGPTETVVGCSAYVLPPGRHRAGPVPVGRAIQNLTFHVLDAGMRPVPVGLPGELYIGGAGVARGYLGRPALSAEKFVPDPFAEPGARMYRTGDRARWLEGGNLLILGRTDNQVKIRGYRVELGEVEALLRRFPGVRECMAVVREDRPGDRRLVAYVVADEADPAALREHLRRSVPEYMVPSAFVVLDALPQTPTGKLDRKALPAPAYHGAGTEFDEPESYLEVQLIQLWEELLGVEGIGPSQSFFDLGGNSFLALRLFALANRRLGCDLPVSTLFEGATVRHMARAIREQGHGAAAPASVVPLQPGGDLPPLFVVHSSDRNVMGYVNLVRHLGPSQPVFGVRDVGDDMARPLERIAAEHVATIRAVQPEGPYYLAGWSFGGFVVYEMAVQLEREGHEVAFVGLLDTMSTDLAQAWPWQGDADLTAALAREVAERMRRPFTLDAAELEGLEHPEQVRRAVEALHAQGAAPPEFDDAALAEACRTIRDRNRSYAGYAPGRFGGTITLFRAAAFSPLQAEFYAPYSDGERHTLGWSRHAGGPVEVHEVPGTHVTIAAEPQVRVLVNAVREALAAARERAGAGALAGREA